MSPRKIFTAFISVLILTIASSAQAELVALWRFDGDVDPQPDYTVNANDAALAGDVAWAFDAVRGVGCQALDRFDIARVFRRILNLGAQIANMYVNCSFIPFIGVALERRAVLPAVHVENQGVIRQRLEVGNRSIELGYRGDGLVAVLASGGEGLGSAGRRGRGGSRWSLPRPGFSVSGWPVRWR